MNENLRQVLIHEIGHYAARQLNLVLYKSGLGVETINLILKDLNNDTIAYQGETEPFKPINYSVTYEIENLSCFIGAVVYGCILEALYREINFYDCFNCNSTGNGDFKKYKFYTELYLDSKKCNDLKKYIGYTYFNKMKIENNHFQKLIDIDLVGTLVKNENGYSVNLKSLENILKDFLDEHSIHYKEFISEIESIIG